MGRMTENDIRAAEKAIVNAVKLRQDEVALRVLQALEHGARELGHNDLLADLALSIAAIERRGG